MDDIEKEIFIEMYTKPYRKNIFDTSAAKYTLCIAVFCDNLIRKIGVIADKLCL